MKLTFGPNYPTGRENVIILYCTSCAWELEVSRIEAAANDCAMCRKRPLNYVKFERGAEDDAAREVMRSNRPWAARLRELLEDHGIDPDPQPPEPEKFGPPTLWTWRMQQAFAMSASRMAEDLLRHKDDALFASGTQWPSSLRIKVPKDFTARH